MLTPKYNEYLAELVNLFKVENLVCLAGSKNSGSNRLAREFLKRYEPCNVLDLDINSFMMDPPLFNIFQIRERLREIVLLSEKYEIVYIKDLERCMNITGNFRFKFSSDSLQTWLGFLREIRVKVVITCSDELAIELSRRKAWYILCETTQEDRVFVLEKYAPTATAGERKEALSLVKTLEIETLKRVVKKTEKYTREKIFPLQDVEQRWTLTFKKILSKLDAYSLDVKETVIKPELNLEMLGIDDIIQEVTREVLEPIKLNSSAVPICKGILMHGPPGTGKSTIGRWLSYQLEGKVYLAESSSQKSLLESFSSLLTQAAANAPSVVFLDDIDCLMDNQQFVRTLLVLLDGINIKGRENVCVVATCMDISCVPDALIRGGRLERCIRFDFPGLEVIVSIIKNRLTSAIAKLETEGHTKMSSSLSKCLLSENLSKMSKCVSGWSPSNIHLVIDAVIRRVASEVEVNPAKIFISEATKIQSHLKTSSQTVTRKITTDLSYYN